MFLALLFSTVILPPSGPLPNSVKIIFAGNSHTTHHDIPKQVEKLLEGDGSKRSVETVTYAGGNTEIIWALSLIHI